MSVPLGTLERVDLRLAWPHEAAAFTPWLASEEGLRLLGDALGIDLERQAEEHPVGPFNADILARRTDIPDERHLVVIENQLEATNHRHLGQLMTYAAGLEAMTIIWVAQEFRDEHRAALDWLNEIAHEDIAFFGVEIELWRIGMSPPAPKFNVVCRPNDWGRAVQEAKETEGPISETREQYLRFWQGVSTLLQERKFKVPLRPPKPRRHRPAALGRSGLWLEAGIDPKDRSLSVECVVRGPVDKSWFYQLRDQSNAIEAEIGSGLDWDAPAHRKRCTISLVRKNADPANEADWPAQQVWMAETLEAFHRAFSVRGKLLTRGVDSGEDDGPEEPDEDATA